MRVALNEGSPSLWWSFLRVALHEGMRVSVMRLVLHEGSTS